MADPINEINCRSLVELVSDYLDETLAPADVEVFEHHLEGCEGCRRYLHQMRTTIRTVGRLREEDVPAEMRERLLGVFRALKRH